ncbi:hypothetical protein ACFX13_037810 [Malus domestica]
MGAGRNTPHWPFQVLAGTTKRQLTSYLPWRPNGKSIVVFGIWGLGFFRGSEMKLNKVQSISDFDPKIRSCIGLWRLLFLLPNYNLRSSRIQNRIIGAATLPICLFLLPFKVSAIWHGYMVAKVFDCRHGDLQACYDF